MRSRNAHKGFCCIYSSCGVLGFFFLHAPSVKANTFPDTTFLKRKPVLRLQSTQMRRSRSVPDFYRERKSLGQEAQACARARSLSLSLSLSVCLTQCLSGQQSTASTEDRPHALIPHRSFWGMDPWLQTVRSLPPGLSRGRSLANELKKKKKERKGKKVQN